MPQCRTFASFIDNLMDAWRKFLWECEREIANAICPLRWVQSITYLSTFPSDVYYSTWQYRTLYLASRVHVCTDLYPFSALLKRCEGSRATTLEASNWEGFATLKQLALVSRP